MKQKLKTKHRVILKQESRFKQSFYSIIIASKKGKFIEKIGTLESLAIKNTKKINLNKFLLIFWLTKGVNFSLFLAKIFNIFLFKNF